MLNHNMIEQIATSNLHYHSVSRNQQIYPLRGGRGGGLPSEQVQNLKLGLLPSLHGGLVRGFPVKTGATPFLQASPVQVGYTPSEQGDLRLGVEPSAHVQVGGLSLLQGGESQLQSGFVPSLHSRGGPRPGRPPPGRPPGRPPGL